MAIKVVVHVNNAADWLTVDANASFRLDRDTSAAFASPTEVTTTALTTGVERYEAWDTAGLSTSWYRFRIEDDGDVALSDWSFPFQVLEQQPIATLASVKQRLGSGANATDDDVLQSIIDGCNGAIIQRIGYYPGPSDDTSRTYSGKDAVRNGSRLWVRGGIRSLTTLSIAGSTGDTATAATASDYTLGPSSYLLRPGEPYQYIEFKDVTTGNWSYFPYGYDNIETTGVYGWGAVPDDLVHVASAWAIRRWKSRNSGDSDVAGNDEFGSLVITDRLPADWRRTIDSYRYWGTV